MCSLPFLVQTRKKDFVPYALSLDPSLVTKGATYGWCREIQDLADELYFLKRFNSFLQREWDRARRWLVSYRPGGSSCRLPLSRAHWLVPQHLPPSHRNEWEVDKLLSVVGCIRCSDVCHSHPPILVCRISTPFKLSKWLFVGMHHQ